MTNLMSTDNQDINKKILIVGAGFGQLPAIKAAKNQGLTTMVVDRDQLAPGMLLADIAIPVDIIDIHNVVEVAKQHRVSGAITMQSDIGVPTVGAIVDALNLSGSGSIIAKRCSSKIETRLCLQSFNVPQPKFKIISTREEALSAAIELGFPCVIKSSDSSGSRGVVKVLSESEVDSAYDEARKYTNAKQILVEEYVEGLEIGAQGFSVNGECVAVLVHDDAVSNPPYMIPIGHSFPSSLPKDILENVEQAVKDCVNALGIQSGPTNIDIILTQQSLPVMIEVGARIGATCLPELVLHYSGIDWVEAAVLSAIGNTPNLIPTKAMPCAAYILQSPEDGILNSVHVPDDVLNHPDLLEIEITAKPGQGVCRFRKGTDRIGKIVTKGKTRKEADDLAKKLLEQIKFEVNPGGN